MNSAADPLAKPDSETEIAAGHPAAARPAFRFGALSVLLFLLTCGSTFFVGMMYTSLPPEVIPETAQQQLYEGGPQQGLILRSLLWGGLQYSAALMSILLFHELGHYLQALRYGVPATPPLFIPMPFSPFGTMGAVIVQSPHHADRKAMFDIAITGPLAGLCLAIPITWCGILHSTTAVVDGSRPARIFGEPLIMEWMIRAVHGPLSAGETVMINPLLMAGWLGLFITALNLTPIGQLDGGHILYCLIGRRAHAVAGLTVALTLGYMAWTDYWLFAPMLVLIVLMGVRHPPTANDRVPLGTARIVLGWLTLAFLVIGAHPRPLDECQPIPRPVDQPPAAVQPVPAG